MQPRRRAHAGAHTHICSASSLPCARTQTAACKIALHARVRVSASDAPLLRSHSCGHAHPCCARSSALAWARSRRHCVPAVLCMPAHLSKQLGDWSSIANPRRWLSRKPPDPIGPFVLTGGRLHADRRWVSTLQLSTQRTRGLSSMPTTLTRTCTARRRERVVGSAKGARVVWWVRRFLHSHKTRTCERLHTR